MNPSQFIYLLQVVLLSTLVYELSALQTDHRLLPRSVLKRRSFWPETTCSATEDDSATTLALTQVAVASAEDISSPSLTSTTTKLDVLTIPIHQTVSSDAVPTLSPSIVTIGKLLQVRHRSSARKPKHYWSDLANVAREISQFWSDFGSSAASSAAEAAASDDDTEVPSTVLTIPNETLLRYCNRHDLRGAIAAHGGRQALAEKLQAWEPRAQVAILPGRWVRAVNESAELQQFLTSSQHPELSPQRPPPIGPQSARGVQPRWSHQLHRRPKGYWSNQTAVLLELYDYVDRYRQEHGRPAAWMPRSSELRRNGRSDLAEALVRFGGSESLCRLAGMVPHREWQYFEGQLELVLDLRRYCDAYQASDYSRFPCVSHMKDRGYGRLHTLIQFYGGRKFLAQRLGMSHHAARRQSGGDGDGDGDDSVASAASARDAMSWGRFDLDFAARLLLWVRRDQLLRAPPVSPRAIAIPSPRRLLIRGEVSTDEKEGVWLHAKITDYGGYENVARRLGLAYGTAPPEKP